MTIAAAAFCSTAPFPTAAPFTKALLIKLNSLFYDKGKKIPKFEKIHNLADEVVYCDEVAFQTKFHTSAKLHFRRSCGRDEVEIVTKLPILSKVTLYPKIDVACF